MVWSRSPTKTGPDARSMYLRIAAGWHRFRIFPGAEAFRERHRAPVGGPDSVSEHRAQTAAVELVQRRGRRPTRRRHHVAKLRGMFLRPLGEGDGTLDCFEDKVVREVARKGEAHRAVDERLHHDEDVGRAGAADRGRHRDEALVAHLTLVAE